MTRTRRVQRSRAGPACLRRRLRSRGSGWTVDAPAAFESVGPEVLDHLAVASLRAIGADRDQLKAVRASFKCSHHIRRDADRVPLAQLDDLVVEAHATRS